MPAPPTSARRGYLLAAAAAALFAGNGATARVLLDDGMPADRLAWLRSATAFVALLVALAWRRPRLLRVRPEHVPRLAFLGVAGLAVVQASYFVAIERLGVGVALTIQYLGPLLILLWLHLAWRRSLPRGMWAAAALSVSGCFLVVGGWDPGAIDGLGLAAALVSAVTFALYAFGSERAGRSYPAVTTLVWAFGFSLAFWSLLAPPWSFPWGELASPGHLAAAAYVCVLGTLVPFVMIVSAVRHVPAARVAVIATLEPVLGAIVAWPALGEALSAVQVLGGLVVVGAVVFVQAQRAAGAEEIAPPWPERAREPVPGAAAAPEPAE